MMKCFARGLERLAVTTGVVGMMTLGGGNALADDTEIYQSTYQSGASGRPKVLIIFDDSGSMDTVVQEGGERPPYETSPATPYVTQFDSNRIYWSDDTDPPDADSDNYFTVSSNRCEKSIEPLASGGKFTTKARRWRLASGTWVTEETRNCIEREWWWCVEWETVETTYWDGDDGEWRALSSTDNSPAHVDCEADIINPATASNPPSEADGYPFQPTNSDASASEAYTASVDDSNVSWGNGVTFYSAHYMDYLYDDTIISIEQTRMEVAQDVVTDLIDSNPIIDFGLAVFNDNTDGRVRNGDTNTDDDNGGRIIRRIVENMTAEQRLELSGDTGLVRSIDARGWTPLCESTFEAYNYLSGSDLVYGHKRDTDRDSPDRDLDADDGTTYTPPSSDCAITYVILMTDGYPTYDTDANDAIETLTGQTCDDYLSDHTDSDGNRELRKNCLPTLTEYMARNDLDGVESNGNQFVHTYTIGFGTGQSLLEDAATLGANGSFVADNASELTAAFQGAILSILATDSTFTAPAVAVDTFTRVQSRNEVFFAMFKPDESKDWRGNIKRLNITFDDDGDAVLVDSTPELAIDGRTGLIKDTATTIWSTEADGGFVDKGGVGALLSATDLTQRANRLYTNTGTDEAFELFADANIDPEAYGFDIIDPDNADALLLDTWGVVNRAELTEVVQWGIGYDTEDEDEDDLTDDNRPWLMQDILHSKPQIVNYGARGSFTEENPDLRILVGTNGAFLHMFGNTDGLEDWAFIPKELGSTLAQRKQNIPSGGHVYGIDAPIVVATSDLNLDGTIDSTVGDKARAYFGLRRGGRLMYALDISNPDSPQFLWKISASDGTGFAELGQTWSVPVVTRIPGYADNNGDLKPVLVFGGGYDPVKDDHDTLAGDQSDTMGRGIFIVDAETGALVWSVSPAANSVTNLQESGLIHSVPGAVTVMDSNGDEVTDRIYFGDTGGNLWRIDFPNNALPTIDQDTWRIVKMFAANGDTKRTDRRFFNAPDVIQTRVGGYPVDAILIGSGDRTNPGEVDDADDTDNPSVDNEFYMIRDEQVSPYFTAFDSDRCAAEPQHDFRCSLPLGTGALYDVTDNLLELGDETEQATAAAALASASGWRLGLVADGEKSLAKSLTIDGKVYFTTFSPDVQVTNLCEPQPGTGRLYNIGLQGAETIRDFDGDDVNDRFLTLGGLIPDTPSAHFGEDGEIRLLLPPGGGSPNIPNNPLNTNSRIPQPYGSYWHREDD